MDCPHFDHHAVLADEDRYRRYAELRACPVARSDAAGGFWILSRFDDVAAAAEDWRTYSSAEGVLAPAPAGRRARQVALEQDPPEHTVYRKLYAELLGRPRVRAIEAEIRATAAGRLAGLARLAEGDFIEHVAAPVPIEALGLLLGLDVEVTSELRELTVAELAQVHRPAGAAGPRPERTLMDLLRSQIEDRRGRPRDDFLTMLVGQDLPPIGLLSFLVGAVIAGHETTLIAATNLAYQLGLDPSLAARLRAEPQLIGRAVDESLRHRPPVQNFVRTLTHDVDHHGTTMRAGDKVMLLFGAANRDPDRYVDADRFDLDRYADDREAARHLAYGHGVHRCVGAFLADVELRILAEELLRYDIELRGEPTFTPTTFGAFLTIDALPVSLRPLGAGAR
ncbi:MAG: cytochrome P450 [Acidimicrobiia bacterium]